jgi:hypothetical protein
MYRYLPVVSVLALSVSMVMQEFAMPSDLVPQVESLYLSSVETLPAYVRGFPAYVAVTIAAPRGVSFPQLRFANLLDLSGCIGLEMTLPDGKVVVDHLPSPPPQEDPRRGGIGLRGGESRRMLTDISQLIPVEVPEGEYRARIAYSPNQAHLYWSGPFNIKLRNPTDVETGWLASQAPDRGQALAWTEWTYTQPKYFAHSGTITPENPLKLNLVLRRLFFGPESLDRVNPGILDVLTEGYDSKVYEPEAWALKAELYQARGDRQKYQECINLITQRTSGLQWWIQMMDSGGSFLSTFRLGPAERR